MPRPRSGCRVSGSENMHRFGLPVRYHDLESFAVTSNLDLVEIHLSYKDLEVNLDQVLPTQQPIGLVVHAPELFAGDHTLDLCSADNDYRRHSIEELQRVVDISRDLRRRFDCPEPVLLVTNVGGFSEHHHLERPELQPLRQRIGVALGLYILVWLIPLLLQQPLITSLALLPLVVVPPVGWLIYWLVWREFHG